MIRIETPEDLEKYRVKESDPYWVNCLKHSEAVDLDGIGPMYYFPDSTDVVLMIPVRNVNFFLFNGLLKFEDKGGIDDSMIYNRAHWTADVRKH